MQGVIRELGLRASIVLIGGKSLNILKSQGKGTQWSLSDESEDYLAVEPEEVLA